MPTPDEVDTLLAEVASAAYAGEAADIVEQWLEEKFGLVGRITLEERGTPAPPRGDLRIEDLQRTLAP